LPYYWDEAWPYGVAVRTMQAHGISLIPGSISTFLARGHPLMFHFLAAVWMDVFGVSLISGHSFALVISILLIITIYQFCKDLFSERVGFIAVLLFASQAIFIAQSVFLVPEMLLALFTLLSFNFFLKGNNLLFIVSTTAMLLTKESGCIAVLAMVAYELLNCLFNKQGNFFTLFKKLMIIAVPVCIASIFFIIQKIKYGWYLYPFYTDNINTNWQSVFEKIPEIVAYFFLYYGRNGLTFFVTISVGFLAIKKRLKFYGDERLVFTIFPIFILLFIIFSAINYYYIPRYLLCAFPPFIILSVSIVDKAACHIHLRATKLIYLIVIVSLAATDLYLYSTRFEGDNDYSPAVKVDLQMVQWCEQQKLFDSYIYANCIMRYDFNEPYTGYTSGKAFSHIEWQPSKNTQYFIFTKDENDPPLYDKIKADYHLKLIKRFKEGYAWVELYQVGT
jgi:4-amino-4-deoxy-L-arabinose transferase-like glycosyltransferase